MTHFVKQGNTFRTADERALDIRPQLPIGTYVVGQDLKGFFLEQVPSLSIDHKLYGETPKNTDRIYNTFTQRTGSTGVILCGEKGSGKTLLAKNLSVRCAADLVPTLLINQPFVGDDFSKFLQSINQPTMVVFDEFEKVYPRERQEFLLTLLDGVYPSKKLFVLTCNDEWRIGEMFNNRPGRVFYRIEYQGVSREFIEEYCGDVLKNQEHTKDVVRISTVFGQFNFDMLKALVEECNRYDESPADAVKMLNIKPKHSGDVLYDVKVTKDGVLMAIRNDKWSGVPSMAKYIHIELREEQPKADPRVYVGNVLTSVSSDDDDNSENEPDDDEIDRYASFYPHDFKHYNPETASFVFANSNGQELSLTKHAAPAANPYAY